MCWFQGNTDLQRISWDLFHLAFLFLVLKFCSESGYFSIWDSLEVILRTIEVSGIWRRKLSTSASRSELNYRSALNFRSMFDWLGYVWCSPLFDKLTVYQHIFSSCTLCSWVVLNLFDLHLLSTHGLPSDPYRKFKVVLNQKKYNQRKFSWEPSA